MIASFESLCPQDLTDNLLVDFFNKTFNDYFDNVINCQNNQIDDTSTKIFYVIKDSIPIPENIITDYANFKLHLVYYFQAYPLIRKGEISTLYTTQSIRISIDTVDIIINTMSVDYRFFRFVRAGGIIKKPIFRSYHFSLFCRGTMGYIPNGRFIYDAGSNEWKHINWRELVEEKTNNKN